MQYQQLEYIIEVTKTGSISEAALNLHVSVPTISQSLSNMEKEFGIKIFERSRTGTKPTERGKVIIEKAFDIRNKWKDMEREAFAQTLTTDKALKLVTSPSPLLTFLPGAIAKFNDQFSNPKIEISENQNVVSEMLKHDTDLGFLSVDEMSWIKSSNQFKNVLHFTTLSQGRMFVCTGGDTSLAQKDSLAPEEVVDETLILHTITKPVYEDILNQYGSLNILYESNNTETILKSITANLGISFLSEFTIKNNPRILKGEVVPVPLVNYERSNLTCGFIRSKKRPYSPAAKLFIKFSRQQIDLEGF